MILDAGYRIPDIGGEMVGDHGWIGFWGVVWWDCVGEILNVDEMGLSDKQMKFCSFYVEGMKPVEAAREAGYKVPANSAWRLMKMKSVQEQIEKLKKQSPLSYTEFVAERLRTIVERCLPQKAGDDLSGESSAGAGEGKFDVAGALKALELLGKFAGMFQQKTGKEEQRAEPVKFLFGDWRDKVND